MSLNYGLYRDFRNLYEAIKSNKLHSKVYKYIILHKGSNHGL